MSEEILNNILSLFISFFATAGSISFIVLFCFYLVNFILGFIFPTKRGDL